jgi:hypothetical protein
LAFCRILFFLGIRLSNSQAFTTGSVEVLLVIGIATVCGGLLGLGFFLLLHVFVDRLIVVAYALPSLFFAAVVIDIIVRQNAWEVWRFITGAVYLVYYFYSVRSRMVWLSNQAGYSVHVKEHNLNIKKVPRNLRRGSHNNSCNHGILGLIIMHHSRAYFRAAR